MLESIDHINLVVRDLQGMVDFYCGVLGLTVSKRVSISGSWIDQTVGLSGVRAEVVYLDLPQGPRIELIQYIHPKAAATATQANTPGLRHLALRVQDIETMTAVLRGAGVRVLGDVQRVPDEQVTYAGGVRKHLVYFQDPEGNLLELCEYKA